MVVSDEEFVSGEPSMKNLSPICRSWLVFGLLLSGGAAARGQQTAPPPAHQPFVFSPATSVIYVSDFELDAENFQADEGLTKVVSGPGIIRKNQDPATQAKKMRDDMATDIVNDLKKTAAAISQDIITQLKEQQAPPAAAK
jgi:Domain of unknown function (DUF4410)